MGIFTDRLLLMNAINVSLSPTASGMLRNIDMIHGFYSQRSFPVFNVTSHPLDCVLDSGHRQVWQRTLVAVESRLSARKNTHQSLAKKNSRNRHESFQHRSIKLCKI